MYITYMTEVGPGRLWQTIHQLAGSADIQLWPGTLCESGLVLINFLKTKFRFLMESLLILKCKKHTETI